MLIQPNREIYVISVSWNLPDFYSWKGIVPGLPLEAPSNSPQIIQGQEPVVWVPGNQPGNQQEDCGGQYPERNNKKRNKALAS